MMLERTGYVEISERQRRLDGRTLSVSPGEELKDVRLTMLMTATVLGGWLTRTAIHWPVWK